MTNRTLTKQCCVVGGGPAGMMLGFLLARAGVEVAVLEKHQDFLRDFRGDTVHPSTLEIMYELGLLDEFLKLPHQKIETLGAQVGAEHLQMADFRHLPTHCKFIAEMPQWDFLNFLAEHGKRYPTLDLRMQAEASDLIEENGLPQPDRVEYGFTCIRLFFERTKHVLIIDIDEPEKADASVGPDTP